MHHRSYSIHIIDTYAGPSYISSVPFNALDLPVRYLQTTAAAKSTSVSIIITCSFCSQFSATSTDNLTWAVATSPFSVIAVRTAESGPRARRLPYFPA